MLNTFFFDYLPLKWKRLSRVLSFVLFPIAVIILESIDVLNPEYEEELAIFVCIWLVAVQIISYTIKPFVVKD